MKPVIFMLDTGSSPSLLKISKVPKYVHINDKEIIVLRRITSHSITTLGKIEIFLDDHKIQFHIVSKDFPIKEARILGSDFFRQTNARINYKSNHLQFFTLKIPFMEGGQVIDRVNNHVSTIQAHKPITAQTRFQIYRKNSLRKLESQLECQRSTNGLARQQIRSICIKMQQLI